jgi:hypothetical protein
MEHYIDDAPEGTRPEPPPRRARVARALWWIAPLLAVGAIATAYLLWPQARVGEPPAAAPPRAAAPPAAAPAEPAIRHPIEEARPDAHETAAAAPLPALEASDQLVHDGLEGLLGARAVEQFVVAGGFVRRIVATVDNLPRQKAPVRAWPVMPTPGAFAATGGRDAGQIDPANARRYEPFVRLVESADAGKAVALYVRLYPLFQQAYRELGYPRGYFNDRLVEVIDHLLAAPEVPAPIRLRQPFVMWEYADPALEARSAGQKTLIRMGPDNARRLKAKLREIRRQVTRAAPSAPEATN